MDINLNEISSEALINEILRRGLAESVTDRLSDYELSEIVQWRIDGLKMYIDF